MSPEICSFLNFNSNSGDENANIQGTNTSFLIYVLRINGTHTFFYISLSALRRTEDQDVPNSTCTHNELDTRLCRTPLTVIRSKV